MTKKITTPTSTPESREETEILQTKTGELLDTISDVQETNVDGQESKECLENKNVKSKELLQSKLELLHTLLVPSPMSTKLPEELSIHTEAFEIFLQSTKGCLDPFDKKYIGALRVLRDALLGQ